MCSVIPGMQLPLRVVAGASWLALAALSLQGVLGQPQIRSGMAYGLAALVTRLAFRHTRSRWQLSAFSLAAALLQVGQAQMSGMPEGLGGWVAGTAGALTGIALARAVDHLSWQLARDRS
jgi:hypothetical protein